MITAYVNESAENSHVFLMRTKSHVVAFPNKHISTLAPKNHTTFKTTNNESDWLVQNAELECYSRKNN